LGRRRRVYGQDSSVVCSTVCLRLAADGQTGRRAVGSAPCTHTAQSAHRRRASRREEQTHTRPAPCPAAPALLCSALQPKEPKQKKALPRLLCYSHLDAAALLGSRGCNARRKGPGRRPAGGNGAT
jgi:hypothetical protein